MVVIGVDFMKKIISSITEKLGNGWQVIGTVVKSLGTTQKLVESRAISG